MRILITNDDGITAPGLKVMEAVAKEIAGPQGEVWTVAPVSEQSGVSHCISYIRPMRLEQLAERRFAVEGSPADCVLAGLHDVLKDTPPDLVLSGVNRGHNVAEDTLYSGTIGAAMEAAMNGHKAIAMSQYYGKYNHDLDDPFDAARAHAAPLVRQLLDKAPWQEKSYATFYNINFPPLPAAKVKGVRTTRQGGRASAAFGVEPHTAHNGRRYLWLSHKADNNSAAPGSDAFEAAQGYATITALHADLTSHAALQAIRQLDTDY
ncbi:MAG: 5'/3'-nucleotidase SurE [Rhodobacteraceae bacterium]|nr:5'/3'-nucleotidase SurE [Paracoccaceae bacterium]